MVYAVNFEWMSGEPDVKSWEMASETSYYSGKDFSSFLDCLCRKIYNIKDKAYIYVKKLNYFTCLAEGNYLAFDKDSFFASMKDRKLNFFYIEFLKGAIQFREWDNFFKKVLNPKTFISLIHKEAKIFKGVNKKTLTFKNHFKFTNARDLWNDFSYTNYLYYNQKGWCEDLLPTSEMELRVLENMNKGGLHTINPAYLDKTLENVHSYDITTCHLSNMVCQRFPLGNVQQAESFEEIISVVKGGFYAWWGEAYVYDLKAKTDLPIELNKWGHYVNGAWRLTVNNVDYEMLRILYDGLWTFRLGSFFYCKQKEIDKNLAKSLIKVFEEKELMKGFEDKDVAAIFKARTELPYGQSIKKLSYSSKIIFDEELDIWREERLPEAGFEEKIKALRKRVLPYHLGLWTVSYSRLNLVKTIMKCGIDNFVYCDTDCIKTTIDCQDIIDEVNKEIKIKMSNIAAKRNMEYCKGLGMWKTEELSKKFKVIGKKWYISNGKATASGADLEVLQNYLDNCADCYKDFKKDMVVPGLFKTVNIDYLEGVIDLTYGERPECALEEAFTFVYREMATEVYYNGENLLVKGLKNGYIKGE